MKKKFLPIIALMFSIFLSAFIMTSNCEAFSSVYAEETPHECMEIASSGGHFYDEIKCPLCRTTITDLRLVSGECTTPPPAPQPK